MARTEFRVGDLVRYKNDPDIEAYLFEVQEVREGGQTLLLIPWGSQTGNSAPSLNFCGDWRRVKRPPAGKRFANQLPVHPRKGAAEAELDFQFIHELAEQLWNESMPYRTWLADPRRYEVVEPMESRMGTIWSKFSQFIFLDAARTVPQPGVLRPVIYTHSERQYFMDEHWNKGGGYSFPSQGLATVEATELYLRKAFTLMLNILTEGAAPARCVWCAEQGKSERKYLSDGTRNPASSCPHFTCSECGQVRTAECGTCSDLYATEHGLDRASTHFCTSCCRHQDCSCSQCTLPGATALRVFSSNCCPRGHAASHCACPRCDRPGCSRIPRACCGQCANHCQCSSHCFPLSNRNDLELFKAPEREKGMKRLLGTELETAGAKSFSPELREARAKWRFNTVTDGSIDAGGVELVTQPAGGSKWEEMINDIGKGFATSKAWTSVACGQHVHVDAGDLNVWDLRRLIRVYAHIEQCLFDALPSYRMQSRYCYPCGTKYTDWLNGMGKKPSKVDFALKNYGLVKPSFGKGKIYATKSQANRAVKESIENCSERKYHESRYSALNLHSYWHRGTIEFRHAHGTCNPEQIIRWGQVCGSIVDYAASKSDASANALLGSPPREAMKLLLLDTGCTKALEWIQNRWDKFTTGHGRHKTDQPVREPITNEV